MRLARPQSWPAQIVADRSVQSQSNFPYQLSGPSSEIRHRHPVSHKCIATTTLPKPSTTIENEKARVLLAKMTSTSASRSPLKKFTKPPIDPTRLAAYRKVELMKMRHKAVPLDPKDKTTSSPLDQRLHLKVRHGNTERLIWARKVCSILCHISRD